MPWHYKAVANMLHFLGAVYCTYQSLEPLNCTAVVEDFRRHYIGTTLWYLQSVECDVDATWQNVGHLDLPRFVAVVLKCGHNEQSN